MKVTASARASRSILGSERTTSPSLALSAADETVAASALFPTSAASVALSRIALTPTPVMAARAAEIFPPPTVTTAATPTTAKREAGWANFA